MTRRTEARRRDGPVVRRWAIKRLGRSAAAGLLTGVLCACSLQPAYERPAPPLAAAYPASAPALPAGGAAIPPPAWSEYFGDPQLRDLIAAALQNNRDLRVAIGRVAEARAVYGIQRADRFPTVAAGAVETRARVPSELSRTGAATVGSVYQASLDLNAWELDFWGRVRSLEDAALQSYLATEEGQRAVQVSLVAQVAGVYLLERTLDEQLGTARRTLGTREEAYRIMRRRYEVGAAPKLDATQAEALLNGARSDLAFLERQREQSHNALVLLVGMPLPDQMRPLAEIEAGFALEIDPGLPSDLLLNRPDVLAAEYRLKASHASIGAARAAFFPRIALTGYYGTASTDLDGLFASGSGAWTFVPSISLPLFDGGRRRSGLDLAEARRDIAVAGYEQTVQAAFREVADALADRRWLARQVSIQRAIVATQTERTRLAQLRYQSGAASYLEVLDAERDRFAAEQLLVQTRRALLASSISLYSALGGGSVPVADHPASAGSN